MVASRRGAIVGQLNKKTGERPILIRNALNSELKLEDQNMLDLVWFISDYGLTFLE